MDDAGPPGSSLAEVVGRFVESRSLSPLVRVGVTGHRALEPAVRDWVGEELEGFFSYQAGLLSTGSRLAAVSSLAIGADQIFAEAALRQGTAIEIVIPFAKFIEDFAEDSERDSYDRLLSAAAATTRLPWEEGSSEAYLAGGLWVVDHCDLLIAIWNGDRAAGVGGTGDVVDYCRDSGKPCIHMDTTTRRIEALS